MITEGNLQENGYLEPFHGKLFSAHLYIAAMGRSGSTYLANLLTTPPARWVMTEPWFINGVVTESVRARCSDFGWPDGREFWWLPPEKRSRANYAERYRNFLSPRLNALERWGVKEVRADFHRPTIATINPSLIIILVRNIREVAASLLEKQFRQGQRADRGPDWILNYCSECATELIGLHEGLTPGTTRLLRYEDLVSDPRVKLELEQWLDWPLNGNPFLGLEEYDRGYEIERHTSQSGPTARQMPAGANELIEQVAWQNSRFQTLFGYQ